MEKQLKRFMQLYPQLELVSDDGLHKELHITEPAWYVFNNRARGVVEVHDVRITNGGSGLGSHVMTDQVANYKIAHDAKKYNTRVFDILSFLDKADDINDKQELLRQKQARVGLKHETKQLLWHNK